MVQSGIKKMVILGLYISIGLLILFSLGRYAGRFMDYDRHKLSVALECLGKSEKERYKVYTSILDETSGNFYKEKYAVKKMIKMGRDVLPWIIQDLNSKKYSFEKNRLLINILGNIDPKEYANAFVGPPFSEYQIDNDLAEKSLSISFLKAADLSLDQKQKILERIRSFGEKCKKQYEEYNDYMNVK